MERQYEGNGTDREVQFLTFLHSEKGLDPIGASDTISQVMNYARPRLSECSDQEIYRGWEEFAEEADTFYGSEAFQQGMDVGIGLGRFEAEEEAHRAFEEGEIELWLDHYQPRTIEEWEEYEARMGKNFSDRWKTNDVKDN